MGSTSLFKIILFLLGILGTCLGGLEKLNSAVASFAKSSLEELAGIEDEFGSVNGSIEIYSTSSSLMSISWTLREMEVCGMKGISNVSVVVNMGAKGTEDDPQMTILMDIISPTLRGTHDLRGHVGNSVVLGNNTLNNNTWTATLSPDFPLSLTCIAKISIENGHVRLGQCLSSKNQLKIQDALIEFPGLVNDSRVDPEMLDDIEYIILDRAIPLGLPDFFGQGLLQQAMIHLQKKFDEVKLWDLLLLKLNTKVNGGYAGLHGQYVAQNTMTERKNEFSRQVISNFTKMTPDPYFYPSNASLLVDSPLVKLNGNLSHIGFHGLSRDIKINVTSNAASSAYHSVLVSINMTDAELTGEYNLEGSIASEIGFGAQGSWSIKNISLNEYYFEPILGLSETHFKKYSERKGAFVMSVEGSELKMPGLLDNVDVSEAVKTGVIEIVRPQIIRLMNNKLSDGLQTLIANELVRKFEEIPAIDIFII
jgi:hypothetical protein